MVRSANRDPDRKAHTNRKRQTTVQAAALAITLFMNMTAPDLVPLLDFKAFTRRNAFNHNNSSNNHLVRARPSR